MLFLKLIVMNLCSYYESNFSWVAGDFRSRNAYFDNVCYYYIMLWNFDSLFQMGVR